MNKRSLWHLTFIMATFILLNTFVFDKGKPNEKVQETIIDVDVHHLPVSQLKTTLGHSVCSTITLGDTYVTLSSDNLPKTLVRGDETVQLIKKNSNGILLYSNKATPVMESVPYLKEGDNFIILSDLSSNEPTVSAATQEKDGIKFLGDAPKNNGIAVVETSDGLAFSGLWDHETKKLTDTSKIEDLKDVVAAKSLSYKNSEEKFYCLETKEMQVVFSDKGGAISEINLKLHSKEDESSIIFPLSIDRKMKEESPQNNMFPLYKAYIVDDAGHTTLRQSIEGGYTPLMRRDILGENGKTLFKVPAEHYALALKNSNKPYISTFKVSKFTKNSIQFKGSVGGKEVTRTYSVLKDAPYTIEMKNSANGHIPSLVISSGIPEAEVDSGSSTPAMIYYNFDGKKLKIKELKLPKDVTTNDSIAPEWTANTNGFFTTILNPRGETSKGVSVVKVEGKDAPSRVTLVDVDTGLYPKEKFPGYEILTPYKSSVVPSPFYFYAGPLEKGILTQVDTTLTNEATGGNPEFIKVITVRGWLTFMTDPFVRFMNIILDFYHMITGSWGVGIILLTITLHLILYPFSAKAHKAQVKMKKVAPKVKALEQKFKNDPTRLRTEQMMLYRNEGINPLASILPMLLPIPFFIGMFDLLKTKFSLRGVPFIPGWIDSLTAPDVVFTWSYNIPFIGNELHILPLIGSAAMFASIKLSSRGQEKNKTPTDMEKQMNTMWPIISVVMIFIFYNMPAGLNIYLIMSSALRALQQWVLNKRYGGNKPGVKVLKN